jgi:uncharacterized repeat protein (TIGR03809 family)
MSAPLSSRRYDDLAHKWHELAERRRSHFIDLYRTGRWKHYYTEAQFIARMREVFHSAEEWARLASPAAEPSKKAS